jgi:hypothetical protein
MYGIPIPVLEPYNVLLHVAFSGEVPLDTLVAPHRKTVAHGCQKGEVLGGGLLAPIFVVPHGAVRTVYLTAQRLDVPHLNTARQLVGQTINIVFCHGYSLTTLLPFQTLYVWVANGTRGFLLQLRERRAQASTATANRMIVPKRMR